MFTGIIEHLGKVEKLERNGLGAKLTILSEMPLTGVKVGDSIAVNGVCLTMTSNNLQFDLGPETLALTTLGQLLVGEAVHLEKSLCLGDPIGGHMVQGHVECTGILSDRQRIGDSLLMRFDAPAQFLLNCIVKGSVAIDGVSLTINSLKNDHFEVCLIPHTLQKTCLGSYRVGKKVNLEADMIGKYVQRVMTGRHGFCDHPTHQPSDL